MTTQITIRRKMHFADGRKGRKVLKAGAKVPVPVIGRIPRVTKLLALAHRFEKLIRDGVVQDYADLAQLGRVTRARVTQIMNLLNLAPGIQEEILFLPAVTEGKDQVTERQLRKVVAVADWKKQQLAFQRISSRLEVEARKL